MTGRIAMNHYCVKSNKWLHKDEVVKVLDDSISRAYALVESDGACVIIPKDILKDVKLDE